jgi:hypothetical protein
VCDEGEAQELDDHRADEGAQDRRAPARERGASNRDRRNGVKLHVLADLVWIGRAVDGHHDEPSHSRQESADTVDRHLDPVHRNPGQARRRGISSGCQHVPAECRRPQHPHRDNHHDQHDDDLEADAEDLPQPDELEARDQRRTEIAQFSELAVDKQLRDAATSQVEHERRDDRLQTDLRHQRAVESAKQRRRDQRRHNRQCQSHGGSAELLGVEQEHWRQHAGNGHQRTDREVDPAGGDDKRHADGNDHNRRDLRHVGVERPGGQKIGREDDVEDDQGRQRDKRAVGADEARKPGSRRPRRQNGATDCLAG